MTTSTAEPAAGAMRPAVAHRPRRPERFAGMLFSLPGLVLLGVFLLLPFAMAIGLSFTNVRLASPLPTRIIGIDNYVQTLSSPDFWQAFRNNIWFTAVVVPVQTAFALWLAILVNSKLRGTVVFRAVYFSPVVVVMAVAATVWLLLFNPERGLVNAVLGAVSGGNLRSDWLESTTMALPAIMLMSIWQGVGFQMIILLAGLQEIPEDLYEAASVDGATSWEQFRWVTLPQLRNTLIFVATVTMILAFRLFDQVWVMTRGGPLGATRTMMIEMVEVGFERQLIARGSAVAVIFFLIVLALTIVQRLFVREETS